MDSLLPNELCLPVTHPSDPPELASPAFLKEGESEESGGSEELDEALALIDGIQAITGEEGSQVIAGDDDKALLKKPARAKRRQVIRTVVGPTSIAWFEKISYW